MKYKGKWYEYVLAVLPFLLVIIWGSSVQLCSIIPVLGGAIGGAISGGMGALSFNVMKKQNNPIMKIVIGVIFIAVAFGICTILGIALIDLITSIY